MSWLNVLLGPVVDTFNQWRDRKHEVKMAEHKLKVTSVESKVKIAEAKAESEAKMLVNRANADINWEIASINNSGWRDEYITVLFTLPAVAIFIPHAQEYVETGFRYLESTPVWYQMVLLAIVGSALGVRIWDSFLKPLKMTKKEPGAE